MTRAHAYTTVALALCALATGACGSDAGISDASIDGSTRDGGPAVGSDSGSDSSVGADSGSAPDAGPTADSGASDSGRSDSGSPSDAAIATTGTFRFLTYNVAGLPDAISGGDPATNTPLISPLLNNYDIALAQEDFSYHTELIGSATHGHISGPSAAPAGRSFGDGLGRLSVFAFAGLVHEPWDECNGIIGSGTDCLAGKGFTMASHELAPGAQVHVYNLHMDAGRSGRDASARADQVRQLVAFMAMRSSGATVIVAGDTNLKEEDETLLLELLSAGSLIDVCRTLGCPDPGGHDRVMYRNATGLELTPTLWREDGRFVDGAGDDLSDHPAVGVDFEWRRTF